MDNRNKNAVNTNVNNWMEAIGRMLIYSLLVMLVLGLVWNWTLI